MARSLRRKPDMRDARHILAPVDCTESSRSSLEYALDLSRASGARVDVVYVWHPPSFVNGGQLVEAHAERISVGELGQRRAELNLEKFLASIPGAERTEARVLVDRAAPAILRIAKERDHDLVVLGRRGTERTGVLGSVAERVARSAPCPVLIVPRFYRSGIDA